MSPEVDHQRVGKTRLLEPEPAPVAPPRGRRLRSPVALAALAAAAVVAAPGASGRESAPKVRTLATVNGYIIAFAQDGGRLATLERPRKTCDGGALVVRRSGGGRPVRIPLWPCRLTGFQFAGARAAWIQASDSGNTMHEWIYTLTLGDRRRRTVDELVSDPDGYGALPSDIAADGAIMVYGVVSWAQQSPDCQQTQFAWCHLALLGGQLNRIGNRSTPIPGTLPPAQLAVGGGRIAIVPALMEACACNAAPAWSPDGSSIAYSTRQDGDWEVVSGPARGPTTKVTDNWTHENDSDWSPDGSRVAYESGGKIVVSNRDGTAARSIAVGLQPAWSPDGHRIAFVKVNVDGLWLVNPDGSGEHRVTTSRDRDPAWSPDGGKLVTARWSSGGWSVTVMDADGSGARALAEGYKPTWSPDGESVAYTRHDRDDEELRVVRADGTGDRSLTANLVNDYSPDWSPDGSRIVFVRGPLLDEEGKGELYTLALEGGAETRITTTQPLESRGAVEIRTLAGGLVSRFVPARYPAQVALSAEVAATLSRTKQAARLELFEPRSGHKLGIAWLPRNSARLSVAGKTAVFSSGRRIWALDARTRRRRLIAMAAADPVGLSIEGRRVAWAENLKTTARVRALLLP